MITRARLYTDIVRDSRQLLKCVHYLYSEELEEVIRLRVGKWDNELINPLSRETQLHLYDVLKSFLYGEVEFEDLKERARELLK